MVVLDQSGRSAGAAPEQYCPELELVLALGAMPLYQAILGAVCRTAILPGSGLCFALRTLSSPLSEDDLSAGALELLCVTKQGQGIIFATELALDKTRVDAMFFREGDVIF